MVARPSLNGFITLSQTSEAIVLGKYKNCTSISVMLEGKVALGDTWVSASSYNRGNKST